MRNSNFYRKYKNQLFGKLWAETESAIKSGNLELNITPDDISCARSPAEIKRIIKKKLSSTVRDYIQILTLSNHNRLVYDSIRYSGNDAFELAQLYLRHDKIQMPEYDALGNPLVTPNDLRDVEPLISSLFAKKIGDLKFCKAPILHHYDQSDPEIYVKQADELLNAIIDDAIVLYCSSHQKAIGNSTLYSVQFAKALQNSKLSQLLMELSSGTENGRKKTTDNRTNAITTSVMAEILGYDIQTSPDDAPPISTSYRDTPEALIVSLIYLFHSRLNLPTGLPCDCWNKFVKKLKSYDGTSIKSPNDILDYFNLEYYDCKSTSSLSPENAPWNDCRQFLSHLVNSVHFSMPTEGITSEEKNNMYAYEKEIFSSRLVFLNYLNTSHTKRRRAFGPLSPRYEELILSPFPEENDKRLTYETPLLPNKNYYCASPSPRRRSRATRTLVFPTEDSFWIANTVSLVSTINETESNYSLLLHTFWYLQKLLGTGYGLNKSVTLDYLNRLTGAVDVALYTGTGRKTPKNENDSWESLRGLSYGGGSISFYSSSPPRKQSFSKYETETQVVRKSKHKYQSKLPYELYIRGLKTKYVIMKHAIFIHMVGVECINKILKSIYHCLDESNITHSLLSNFNPYADIDKMINVIVDGQEPRHFDYSNLVPEEDPDLST